MPNPEPESYLAKAQQNLAAAELLLPAGHYDASCSRAYYAAFQAAVAAPWLEGVRPARTADYTLSHTAVQNEWSGRLVYRRKLYPAELRSVLQLLYRRRLDADYRTEPVAERAARGAVLRARQLVTAVEQKLQST